MKFNNTILAILSLGFFCSCETETILGPDIEAIGAIPEPISELESSRDTIDFTNSESIYFSLEFEESTSWVLTLTGQNSGASVSFQDVSASINESNSNWEGQTQGAFFQIEPVIAEVSFPSFMDEPFILDTFTISGIETADIQTVLYSDFSDVSHLIYNFDGVPPAGGGWVSDFHITESRDSPFPLYDGNAFIYFEGTHWQGNGSDYVDLLKLPSNLGDTLNDEFLPLFSDPERVYVNLAVYNTGTEYTKLRIELTEQSSTGPTRYVDVRPDWEGWKLVSIKYSDLLSDDTGIYEPQLIAFTTLFLFTDQNLDEANKETVSVAVDQLTFSFDAPLGTVSF